MKWYGHVNFQTAKKIKKLKRFLAPSSLTSLTSRSTFPPLSCALPFPSSSLIVIKIDQNTPVFVFQFAQSIYKIIFPISLVSNPFLDTNASVVFVSLFFRSFLFNTYIDFLKSNFMSNLSFFVIKMKFKGKGYNIFRNTRNSILFKFGYSHRIYGFFKNVSLLNFTKTSLIFISIERSTLQKKSENFFNVKPINLYTGRGIRFAKQIVYRKLGKVGSYR